MPSAPPSGTCGDGIREMCRTPAEDERRRGVCDRGLPALGLPLRSPLISHMAAVRRQITFMFAEIFFVRGVFRAPAECFRWWSQGPVLPLEFVRPLHQARVSLSDGWRETRLHAARVRAELVKGG